VQLSLVSWLFPYRYLVHSPTFLAGRDFPLTEALTMDFVLPSSMVSAHTLALYFFEPNFQI
jgi:hypothetical protein